MLIKDIEKMEAYTPTEYVNDSEPDLDADNLNKTERQLRDTVAKANEIIDTLKSLISNVSVNSEDTVPSSAVAYKMEQDIEQLNSNIPYKIITKSINNLSINDNGITAVENDLSKFGSVCDGYFCSLSGGVTAYQLYNGDIKQYSIGIKNLMSTQISVSGRIFYFLK